MTSLEQTILRTVAYFDLFSYPLTPWEIWKWGWGDGIAGQQVGGGDTPSYNAVVEALQTSVRLQEKLDQASGFVFLKGQASHVVTRQARYRLALKKFTRAQAYTRMLARLPFVRAVAVCNSLGMSNAREESDIDFFIITKPGHIWTTRLFSAGWAQLRKLRPLKNDRTDKTCLSFFITEDVGNLSMVRKTDDPYFTMWLATLAPLYDPQNLFGNLWQQNTWMHDALPNAQPRTVASQRQVRPAFVQAFVEVLTRSQWLERLAEWWQQRRLPPPLRALANQDTRVVLNHSMLKFHDNDRRDEYAQRFRQQCASLGI